MVPEEGQEVVGAGIGTGMGAEPEMVQEGQEVVGAGIGKGNWSRARNGAKRRAGGNRSRKMIRKRSGTSLAQRHC